MRLLLVSTFIFLFAQPSLSAGAGQGIFERLVKMVLPDNYQLKWKDIDFSVDFTHLDVKSKNLCFTDKKTQTSFCFKNFELRLPFLKAFIPDEDSRLILTGGSATIDSRNSKAVKKDNAENTAKVAVLNILPFLSYIKYAKPLDLAIDFEQLEMISLGVDGKEEKQILKLKLNNKNFENQSVVEARIYAINSPMLSGKESFVNLKALLKEEKFKIELKTNLNLPSSDKEEMDRFSTEVKTAWSSYKTEKLEFFTIVDLEKSADKINLQLNNTLTPKKLTLNGSIKIPNRGTEIHDCNIQVNLNDAAAIPALKCDLRLNHPKNKKNELATGQMVCRANSCSLDVLAAKVGELGLKLELQQPFSLETSGADLKLSIESYRELAKMTEELGFALPAPFAFLQGPFQLNVDAKPKNKKVHVALDLSTELSSDHQKIYLKSESFVEMKGQKATLDSETLIKNLQIVLPTLELLEPVPAFSPDSRIAKKDKEVEGSDLGKKPALDFKHNVRLRTEKQDSFRVKTNLLKNPIPIYFDVTHSSQSPNLSGIVRLKDVELELFRRKALVESFTVDLKSEVGKSPLKGFVRIEQNGYKILFKILGSVESPFFKMESEPFLPPSDIISVLLFGKTNSELSGAEADSVNGMQQAMSARAFSLLSLFFLSSTPIESIIYDPVTNTISASVKLAGNRLSVSSQSGSVSRVGLERRVFANINLRTYKDFDEDDSSVTTVLEWEKRY